jgi:tRNA(fMet)-specific endonuclease VapC
MIRWMLDTNACIAIINQNPPQVRQRLLRIAPTDVAISEIVRYELAYGVCNSQQPERNQVNLTHFLRYVQVLEWGEVQSLTAAQIRCELARKGMPIGHYDTLLAAHARSLDVTLVTRNTRELGCVDGLHIENWALDASEGAQP